MTTITLTFDNTALMLELCGPHDSHLLHLEHKLGVKLLPRGNQITLAGPDGALAEARNALNALYARLEKNQPLTLADVDGVLRLNRDATSAKTKDDLTLTLPKRTVSPRSEAQADYLRKLNSHELTFGIGPAGTGKTYLAVAHAAQALLRGDVEKLILSRPAVEAGERIGFLPGDMKDKVDPYLRPLYDALYDVLHTDFVDRRIASGDIEIAPLAFMRGRTLSRAVIILDEAQNATIGQMKMFLTRLGEGSRMVVTGDPSQTDLPDARQSGLGDAQGLLKDVKGVATAKFTGQDVVRHRLVKDIVLAYDARAKIPDA